jgi:Threonine synthase
MTTLSHLECSYCGKRHEARRLHNLCECGGPLLVRYDLEKARAAWSRDSLAAAPSNMWRYSPVLPLDDVSQAVTLGEGWTPLIHTNVWASRWASRIFGSRMKG